MTGRLLSPRGVEGAYDILHYMTGEDPYTTQIPRFMQECAPQLKERFEELLRPYYAQLEQGRLSEVDLFKLLTRISEDIGTSMLDVGTIDSSDHAVIDPMTEMELDYGPEIRKKIITFDAETGEERKGDEDE